MLEDGMDEVEGPQRVCQRYDERGSKGSSTRTTVGRSIECNPPAPEYGT